MDLDSLLYHYLDGGNPEDFDRLNSAGDRIVIDFGVEQYAGRRFALWALLLMLGRAPDPELAFKKPAERRAAHDFARLMASAEAQPDDGG